MGIHATMKLRDSFGRTTSKRIEHTSEVLSAVQSSMGVLAPLLAAITDLELVDVTYSFKDNSEAFAGAATSNIDTGATFRVDLTAGGQAAHKIPGFPLAKVVTGGSIPVDDSDVVAYFAQFEAGNPWRISDGESISAVVQGLLDT